MNALILLFVALAQTPPAPSIKVVDTRLEPQAWNASRVDIAGEGWLGTDITGPIVQFIGTTDGFVLGDGSPYRATGGRLERLKVVRKGTGGDAIKAVGYDDATKLFKFKNSWGKWGAGGYGFLPYAYVARMASDCWTVRVVE